MPLDFVPVPKKEAWKSLNSDFSRAVDLTHRCTKKKHNDFGKTCIHVTKSVVEASDNSKCARWGMNIPVEKEALVRGTTLKTIVPLGMTNIAEVGDWLHFKNPYGLRVSLKKWEVEKYPCFDEFLKIRGQEITLPKILSDAVDRAEVMLDSSEESVKVTISKNQILIEGRGIAGESIEARSVVYSGKSMSFLVPSTLVKELIEQQTRCEVSERCIRIANENYTYLTSLEI